MSEADWSALVEAAGRDPLVAGLVLTGGRGKGVWTDRSDWDGLLLVADDAVSRWQAALLVALDISLLSTSEFTTYAEPGTAFAWRGYDLAHLHAAVDHLPSGGFQAALDRKGRLDMDVARPIVEGSVGAALNHLYRAAKSTRDGDMRSARWDLSEMVPVWLAAMFALESRHRPYNKLLAWELGHHPLRSAETSSDEVLAAIDMVISGDITAAWRLEAWLTAGCRSAEITQSLDGWVGHLAEVTPKS